MLRIATAIDLQVSASDNHPKDRILGCLHPDMLDIVVLPILEGLTELTGLLWEKPSSVPFPLERPYVDLVNILLTCGEEVREAITQSVQAQCEQSWGSLCSVLSFCTSVPHGDSALEPEKKPNEIFRSLASQGDILVHPEPDSRSTRGERGGRLSMNPHIRSKPGSHNPKMAYGIIEQAEELSEFSDIRR
uniref:Uncharacterized protein n=1 Tax=Sphaerodactylus townsendi TaxID=933632 RepID=A0ACB8EJ30_9SAUR